MRSIHVIEDTLPMAWEQAVLACWDRGAEFKTEYDKPTDPPSKDCVLMMHVKNPFAEPRIHRCFPGGLDFLEIYRSEILYGVKDSWVNPAEGKWQYTYHERLFEYATPKGIYNQVAMIIDRLRKTPYTRRAQISTWKVWEDNIIDDPTCLQRIWCRIEDGKLNMVASMRSNDLYKATFLNAYAFTELQAWIAKELDVKVGEYIHFADSAHIYGSYFPELEGFAKTVAERPYEERVWDTETALPMFIEGCDSLLRESIPQEKKDIVTQRKNELLSLTK